MKNKDLLSFSLPLSKEICRMYWYVPAMALVLFFFGGIFPVLSNLSVPEGIEWYIEGCLRNSNLFYLAILLCTPVITAVMMMSFLHREDKALMLHAQPLSKSRIFNTYYITGWVMCVVPVIVTLLSYLMLMVKVESIDFADLIYWLGSSISILTFYYGIAILAGTLTGTTVMNLLSTGVLLVIIPLIILMMVYYCELFMYGFYEIPESFVTFAVNSGPIWGVLIAGERLSGMECVIFFMLGIALMALSSAVYKSRKLEFVGTATLSKGFEEVMTCLVVFVGMGAFGLITVGFTGSRSLVVVGMVLGAAITMLLVKLIVNKTIKIFNKDLLKSFAIYSVIGVLFISFTMFDLGGISKKVPAAEDVAGIEINGIIDSYGGALLNYGYASEEYMKSDFRLTSEESIQAVIELHNYIIESGIYKESYADDNRHTAVLTDANGVATHIGNEYVRFIYTLKDGSTLQRTYDIWLNDEIVDMIDGILTSQEYAEKTRLSNIINQDKISYVKIQKLSKEDDGETGDADTEELTEIEVIQNSQVISGLLEAWDSDISRFGYKNNNRYITEEFTGGVTYLADIQIFFRFPEGFDPKTSSLEEAQDAYEEYIGFTVTDLDTQTIRYLTEQGYGDLFNR